MRLITQTSVLRIYQMVGFPFFDFRNSTHERLKSGVNSWKNSYTINRNDRVIYK